MKLALVIVALLATSAAARPPEGLPWSLSGTVFESAPLGGWATTQPVGCEVTFRWSDDPQEFRAIGPSGTTYAVNGYPDVEPIAWLMRDVGTAEEASEPGYGVSPVGLALAIPRYGPGGEEVVGETRFVCASVDWGEKWDYVLIVRQMAYGMAFWFCWEFGLCALGLGFKAITHNAESLFLR